MEEYFFICPYCFQQISMLIDTSLEHQEYIEDCEVCCNPIQVKLTIEENSITNFEVSSIDQ
jgi:hypothetical protein